MKFFTPSVSFMLGTLLGISFHLIPNQRWESLIFFVLGVFLATSFRVAEEGD